MGGEGRGDLAWGLGVCGKGGTGWEWGLVSVSVGGRVEGMGVTNYEKVEMSWCGLVQMGEVKDYSMCEDWSFVSEYREDAKLLTVVIF